MYIAEGEAEGLSRAGLTGRGTLLRGRIARARAELGLGDRLVLSRELALTVLGQHRKDGSAASSALTMHRNLAAFARWCVARGLVEEAATTLLGVKRPKVPKNLPEPLSADETRRLLWAAAPGRDRLLIRVLLGTGLRVSECAALTIDDVVERQGVAVIRVIRGKGARDRYVPAGLPGEPLGEALRDYIDHDRRVVRDDPQRRLWLRHAVPHDPMTAWAIWRVVSVASRRAGIPRMHPHLARHTFASRLIALGLPTEIVRQAGGWSSLQTLQIYLKTNIGDVLDAWARAAGPQP